ncbi:hypothetical protein L1887_13444 [Cichorium endivia]|nr:hypothetical protein L1887_13444 [Cichorium endivia]
MGVRTKINNFSFHISQGRDFRKVSGLALRQHHRGISFPLIGTKSLLQSNNKTLFFDPPFFFINHHRWSKV